MRGRLLRSTLVIALVAIVTLGVPLVLLARHEVWTSARDTLRQEATSTAAGLEDRLDARQSVDLTRYVDALPGRRIVVTSPQGVRQSAGAALTGAVLSESVHVADYTVTVQSGKGSSVTRVREVTALVATLALLAIAAAVALASRQARRLAAPLSDLADHADSLGRGEFAPSTVASGIPEIDRVSHVLERSGVQIATMLEQQRNFASDAAHQLRTPLTGIALRLDELSRIGDHAVRQEAEDGLAQVARLDRVITALLARARGDSTSPTRFELAPLIDHEASLWAEALRTQDRTLALDLSPGLYVLARRDHVAGVLTCLLDNALQHGAGTVTVLCRGVGDEVHIEVADAGPGVPVELLPHVFTRSVSGGDGSGIGLSLARSLATTENGRLDAVPLVGSRFRLTLPVAPARAGRQA